MRTFFYFAGGCAGASVAVFFICLSWFVGHVLPRQLDSLRADVNEQLLFGRQELAGQVTAARDQVVGEVRVTRAAAVRQLEGIRGDLRTESGAWRGAIDGRLAGAVGTLDGVRADLKPVLAGAAALAEDGRASWDDLYWDVKATVASATVATTSAAQASEAIRDAAPKVAASVVRIGDSSAGIAADVRMEADKLTAPHSLRDRIFEYLKMSALVAHYFF
jgi:hypothetical protein